MCYMDLINPFISRPIHAPHIEVEEREIILPADEPPKGLRPFVYFISGFVGGLCSLVVAQPLDTIKFRLQTMPNSEPAMYRGTYDCFRKILQREGIPGLYRGMGLQIYSYPSARAVNFFFYGLGKSVQEYFFHVHPSSPMISFTSGMFAGLVTTVLSAPSERVKVLLQHQSAEHSRYPLSYKTRCGPHYSGTFDIIFKLYKTGGIRSVFKGASMTLMRDMPSGGVYYMSYEILKSYSRNENDESIHPAKAILAGGAAGVLYWLIALPSDILKSKLQSTSHDHPQSFRDIFRDMFVRGGITSFYKGFVPVMLEAFLGNGACFLGFEYSKNHLLKFV